MIINKKSIHLFWPWCPHYFWINDGTRNSYTSVFQLISYSHGNFVFLQFCLWPYKINCILYDPQNEEESQLSWKKRGLEDMLQALLKKKKCVCV